MKRERLVELRSRESAEFIAPSLTREQLEVVFDYYANFGRSGVMTPQKSMDSFMFMKFCRECPDLVEGCVCAILLPNPQHICVEECSPPLLSSSSVSCIRFVMVLHLSTPIVRAHHVPDRC